MDLSADILSQLQLIKWLLLALLLFGILLVAVVVIFVVNALDVMGENSISHETASKLQELEDLLAQGKARSVKFDALQWLRKEPKRWEAGWILARAYYHLGELAEAKQAFAELLETSPDEHFRVNAWLELIEQRFAEERPKVL